MKNFYILFFSISLILLLNPHTSSGNGISPNQVVPIPDLVSTNIINTFPFLVIEFDVDYPTGEMDSFTATASLINTSDQMLLMSNSTVWQATSNNPDTFTFNFTTTWGGNTTIHLAIFDSDDVLAEEYYDTVNIQRPYLLNAYASIAANLQGIHAHFDVNFFGTYSDWIDVDVSLFYINGTLVETIPTQYPVTGSDVDDIPINFNDFTNGTYYILLELRYENILTDTLIITDIIIPDDTPYFNASHIEVRRHTIYAYYDALTDVTNSGVQANVTAYLIQDSDILLVKSYNRTFYNEVLSSSYHFFEYLPFGTYSVKLEMRYEGLLVDTLYFEDIVVEEYIFIQEVNISVDYDYLTVNVTLSSDEVDLGIKVYGYLYDDANVLVKAIDVDYYLNEGFRIMYFETIANGTYTLVLEVVDDSVLMARYSSTPFSVPDLSGIVSTPSSQTPTSPSEIPNDPSSVETSSLKFSSIPVLFCLYVTLYYKKQNHKCKR